MAQCRTLSFLVCLPLIICLGSTVIRSHASHVIKIPLGTRCDRRDVIVRPVDVFALETPGNTSDAMSEFVNCQILFTSSRNDGRLCVIQDGPDNLIRDPNVEMVVEDNLTTVFHLYYYPSRWYSMEYCSASPTLSVSLTKINRNFRVLIDKLDISLKIVDIQSRHRRLYFNANSCTYTYQLRHSWVSLSNRSPYEHHSGTNALCGLQVVKGDADRKICFVYQPLLTSRSMNGHWNFYVSKLYYSMSPEGFIYQFSSNDSQATTLHAWCAEADISSVVLIFQRVNMTDEPLDIFRFTLIDYHYQGSSDSLLQLWNGVIENEARVVMTSCRQFGRHCSSSRITYNRASRGRRVTFFRPNSDTDI